MKGKRGFIRIGVIPALLLLLLPLNGPGGAGFWALPAIVLHECGHLAAARLLGVRLRCIDVEPFGAVIRVRGGLLPYFTEGVLCAAGPCANVVTAGAAAGAALLAGREVPGYFLETSLVLAALNLLPVKGFDGGRILSCLVCSGFGPRAGDTVTDVTSFLSVTGLWLLSVYLLLRCGTSLSLFAFSVSVFRRACMDKAELS